MAATPSYAHRQCLCMHSAAVHAGAEERTLFLAVHGARLADLLVGLRVEQRDAARANVLVPDAAHDLKLLLLRAVGVDDRLVHLPRTHSVQSVPGLIGLGYIRAPALQPQLVYFAELATAALCAHYHSLHAMLL